MIFGQRYLWSRKREKITLQDGSQKEILRLIINLVPSNMVLLPNGPPWRWSKMRSSFGGRKIFLALFTSLSCQRRGANGLFWLGRCPPNLGGTPPGPPVHLGLRVIPMGWVSAVGIREHILRRLNTIKSPIGVGLPAELELRKDRPVPADEWHRCRKVYH